MTLSPETDRLCAFGDESSAVRSETHQEYLVGAVVLPSTDLNDIREELRPLLLPGQIKLHWTAESEKRRRHIVDALAGLGAMHFVISHVSTRSNKTERFRRKCLESLYYELAGAEIHAVTLESRNLHQDKADRAQIVALQGQGLDRRLRIEHALGGDEPLLWIPDALLGAVNSKRLGDSHHWERFEENVIVDDVTSDSMTLDP